MLLLLNRSAWLLTSAPVRRWTLCSSSKSILSMISRAQVLELHLRLVRRHIPRTILCPTTPSMLLSLLPMKPCLSSSGATERAALTALLRKTCLARSRRMVSCCCWSSIPHALEYLLTAVTPISRVPRHCIWVSWWQRLIDR
jgi:hypothetical protein